MDDKELLRRAAKARAPLISSQRFLDPVIVADKAARFKVFIVRVADVTLRDRPYRVLTDGHHNLAAARKAGIEPTWRGPSNKWQRIQASMPAREFERFLINNLTDSDWYDVDSGRVVQELLAFERGPSQPEGTPAATSGSSRLVHGGCVDETSDNVPGKESA